MTHWMIYGANGYTGRLLAERAEAQGATPILAGRSAAPIEEMGAELGLSTRVFPLDDPGVIRRHLGDIDAVLHAAGPFSRTARPMFEACLDTATHYLDITGEIAVFEMILERDEEVRRAGVVALPGVGFDVVPTDCLASTLHAAVPDATRLELAFSGIGGGSSQGTLKTVVESLGRGGAARVNSYIRRVPSDWKSREIPFPSGEYFAVTIPWGDVSTAYHSTGIPNIWVYTAMPASALPWLQLADRLGPVLQNDWVQRALTTLVEWTVEGPTDEELRAGRSEIWGRAQNNRGVEVSATMVTPQGYALTVDSALRATRYVLEGRVEPGAWTPSGALGADFVLELDGVERSELRQKNRAV
jgi:saccharopine dehydrogenase (NAD+, L-lysine-forming)